MVENKLALIVGENIPDRRRRLGLSQKELAERLEISQDAMARWGDYKISLILYNVALPVSHSQ